MVETGVLVSREVFCGTDSQCNRCPFSELEPARAQELGGIAVCFAGPSIVPSEQSIKLVAELDNIEVEPQEINNIKNAAIYMSVSDRCKIKENE